MLSSRTVILTSIAALGLASPSLGQNYKLRLVAQTGDPAPGSIGGSFLWLGWPTINASGQVAFVAGSDGLIAETGMWRSIFDDPQHCELIIGQDYPVPGSPPGIHFGEFHPSFHHPLLNDAGNVGFSAPTTTLPEPGTGLFRMVNGSIQRVAMPGDVAPGTAGTATYESLGNLPAFNQSNSMAFSAKLAGRGVNAGNDQANFMHWFGGVQMIVREGNGVPGMPGSTFSMTPLDLPSLDDTGKMAFNAAVLGANPKAWSRWQGWPGLLEMRAFAGQATPVGGVLSSTIPDFWAMTVGFDQIAFTQGVQDASGIKPAVWNASGSGLHAYAVAGQLGPLGFYQDLPSSDPSISGDGTVAFRARFNGFGIPLDTDTALLRVPVGGPATVLVREGDPATGWPAGVEFDDLLNFWLVSPCINDSHDIVLEASVRGPGIGPSNDMGLFVVGANESLHSILREGQSLVLGGHPPRQVSDWTVLFGISEHGGRRPGINSRGDVAIRIVFSDESTAVVVAQRPPACAADLNGDGVIDATDLALLLGAWGDTGPVGEGGDVDWDGDTDGADLAILLGAWGPCQP